MSVSEQTMEQAPVAVNTPKKQRRRKRLACPDNTEQKQGKPAPQAKASVPRKNGDNTGKAISEPYKPNRREQAVIDAYLARERSKPPAPSITVKEGMVAVDHADTPVGGTLLMSAIGATDSDFVKPVLDQLINVGSIGPKPDPAGINFMLSVVKGIEPRDQLEAMLGAQMAAVHMQTMTFARRLAHVENIQQQDSAERAFNKLTRTFTSQMEALKQYRTGGQQKVTVEHFHNHAGGQAIVGDVNVTGGGGGGQNPNCSQPHAPGISEAFALAAGASVWSPDAGREPVPIAEGEWSDPVSDARRGEG